MMKTIEPLQPLEVESDASGAITKIEFLPLLLKINELIVSHNKLIKEGEINMEVTREQIASDIVRNLAEALAALCKVDVDNYLVVGLELRTTLGRKLQKWTKDL